ncbi:MAG TPA: hypothetical protein PLA19_01280 [Candidatus Pacearchaeota archaeon]|nr:hypothetical protein [Candidatus Pacearchaeota archaeon]
MNLKSKILAAGLAAIIAGFGMFAANINTVQAQTDGAQQTDSAIAQMMQMIETLKQQIQQIIALIAQLKPQETCGNGACRFGETAATCPADCGQITACAKEGVIVLPYQSCCAGLARIACSGNYCHDNGSGICAKCGNGICGLGEAAANCPADCFGAKTCYSEGEGETGEVGLTAGITIPCCSGLYPNGTQAVTGGFICRKLIADFNNTKPDTVVNCKKEGELFGYLEGECCDGLLKVYPDGAKTYSPGESQNFQVTCKKPAN